MNQSKRTKPRDRYKGERLRWEYTQCGWSVGSAHTHTRNPLDAVGRMKAKGVRWNLNINCFLLDKFSVACDALSLQIILNSNVYSKDPKINANATPPSNNSSSNISVNNNGLKYMLRAIRANGQEKDEKKKKKIGQNKNGTKARWDDFRRGLDLFAAMKTHRIVAIVIVIVVNYLNRMLCQHHPI